MLTAGVACYRAWLAETEARAGRRRRAIRSANTRALVAAGALSLADALPLVRFRAQAMQEAVPVGAGAMAAILGLDAAAVRRRLRRRPRASTGEVVEAVNFNDPKQTVIAGSKAGVDKACELLKAAGAKRALPLPVSAPFHSQPDEAGGRAAARAAGDDRARRAADPGDQQHRRRGARATRPRSATRSIARPSARCAGSRRCRRSRRAASRHIVECGPGKVLAGMVKRIEPDAVAAAVFDPASLADAQRRCCNERSASSHGQVALVTGASRGIGRGDRARARGARA